MRINVHPYVEAFINKRTGWNKSLRKTWQKKYNAAVEVYPSTANGLLEYHFIDSEGEDINL